MSETADPKQETVARFLRDQGFADHEIQDVLAGRAVLRRQVIEDRGYFPAALRDRAARRERRNDG